MKTRHKRAYRLRIAAIWCFTVGLFLSLPSTAWSIADSLMHKAPIPLDLPLSGTVTDNQYQKGSKIVSTQIIENGKTTYLAEEEVVLDEGFAVEDGAEFEILFDRDSFHIVTLLTYNLWTHSKAGYNEHMKVVKTSKADVVSLQEVHSGKNNFDKLISKTSGYDGKMYVLSSGIPDYGIGMLWNSNTIGKPIEIQNRSIKISDNQHDKDKKRAYMIAEFRDFCFVATHFSLDQKYRNQMAYNILDDSIVQRCTMSGKPVYVAGDMNTNPKGSAITIFENNGYEVLNNTETLENGKYIDSTQNGGGMIDLILEYNTNPYRKKIDRGVALSLKQRESGWLGKISDHFPYFVKLKVR